MKLVRYRPEVGRALSNVLDVRGDFDRLFNLSGFGEEPGSYGDWSPQIDVYEEKDSVILKADLPGLTKDSITVNVEENIVTLEGTKEREEKSEETGYYRCERWHGSFKRSFEIPAGVDAAKVKAGFKDGVLTVTLPRSEASKPRKVDIEVK